MDKITASEVMVAALSRKLFQNGVSQIDLEITDLELPKDLSDNDNLFVDAMVWMTNEGLIRQKGLASNGNGGTFAVSCVMTSYGFSTMNNMLEDSSGKTTLGGRINEVVSSGGNWSGPGELFGGLLGSFTKSISS